MFNSSKDYTYTPSNHSQEAFLGFITGNVYPSFSEWKTSLTEASTSDDVSDDLSLDESVGVALGLAAVAGIASYIGGRKQAADAFNKRNTYIEAVLGYLDEEDKIYELKIGKNNTARFKVNGVLLQMVYTKDGKYEIQNMKTGLKKINNSPEKNMIAFNTKLADDINAVFKNKTDDDKEKNK